MPWPKGKKRGSTRRTAKVEEPASDDEVVEESSVSLDGESVDSSDSSAVFFVPIFEDSEDMSDFIDDGDDGAEETFFFRPHTLSALALLLAAMFAVALSDTVRDLLPYSSSRLGFAAVVVVFLFVAMVTFRNGPFVRPHPAFWRAVTGMGILYLLVLVFLFFHSADEARLLLKRFDDKLGIQLPERNYGDSCEIVTPNGTTWADNVWGAVNDRFVVAHFVGWIVKMLMLRDFYICWVLSVLFEFLEYAFTHMLPNFGECWWDHWILDVVLCNFGGMVAGWYLLRYLKVKEYHWVAPAQIPSLKGKVKRGLLQFTPRDWTTFNWAALSSFKRFTQILALILVFELVELNAFFMKTILWISPEHDLNAIRLLIWALIGLPALREYYQYVTDPRCKKLGASAWLCAATAGVELLLCVKFGQGMFPEPLPAWVYNTTLAAAVGLAAFSAYYFGSKAPIKPADPHHRERAQLLDAFSTAQRMHAKAE